MSIVFESWVKTCTYDLIVKKIFGNKVYSITQIHCLSRAFPLDMSDHVHRKPRRFLNTPGWKVGQAWWHCNIENQKWKLLNERLSRISFGKTPLFKWNKWLWNISKNTRSSAAFPIVMNIVNLWTVRGGVGENWKLIWQRISRIYFSKASAFELTFLAAGYCENGTLWVLLLTSIVKW